MSKLLGFEALSKYCGRFCGCPGFCPHPHPPFLCFLFPESNNFSFANNGYSGDLEIFENVAYIMACHADPSIPGTIDEWLDQFEMFSIYQVLPQILELWGENLLTQVASKKGPAGANGK